MIDRRGGARAWWTLAGACAWACDPTPAAAPPIADAPSIVAAPEDIVELDEATTPGPAAVTPSDAPPEDPAAIGRWLRGGGYRGWAPSSPIHATGEHGGARVLFNPLLAASWAAGGGRHPLGAAAVRELYEDDLATPRGFALMIKVAEGDVDRGWFWYEVFGQADDDDARPTVSQIGAPGCVGCHAGGVDGVMAPEGVDGVMAPDR